MRRERPTAAGFLGQVLFLILLALPAALRFVEHWQRPARREEVLQATRAAARAAALEESLRRAEAALGEATGFAVDAGDRAARERYRAHPVEVLPFGDPSPTRDAFWVTLPAAYRGTPVPGAPGLAPPAQESVPAGAAVVHGGALLGRLERIAAGVPVGRVETLLDPAFRVRFRCGDARGILHGGRREPGSGEGRPLLEAHHVTPLDDLPAGAPVTTDGGDGVYPPGLLIGRVVPREDQTSSDVQLVEAARSPQGLREAAVLFDTLRGRWSEARGGAR